MSYFGRRSTERALRLSLLVLLCVDFRSVVPVLVIVIGTKQHAARNRIFVSHISSTMREGFLGYLRRRLRVCFPFGYRGHCQYSLSVG